MKKSLVLISLIGVVLILAVLFVAAYSSRIPLSRINEKYNEISEKLSNGNITEEEEKKLQLELSELFLDISLGKKETQSAYAELLRKITNNAYEFDDGEVFQLASQLHELMKTMEEKGKDVLGVQDIKMATDALGNNSLIVSYMGVERYSVRMMDEAEEEYTMGDYTSEYNGDLGKYRIEIMFYDSGSSVHFRELYPVGEVCEPEYNDTMSQTLKFRCAYTPDHAFVIYVGSNEPINVEKIDREKLKSPIGDIEIVFKTEE